jgi:hypothetical protein
VESRWTNCERRYRSAPHQVFAEDGVPKIMVASLLYLDVFARVHGRWYFAERDLILDWSETRLLGGQ